MDIRLNTLLTVIETGSYTLAAEKLMFTQPAVSHHIKQLESEYGIRIFLKTGKNLELTEAGRLLADYAIQAKKAENALIVSMSDLSEEPCHFSVGVSVTTAENILPALISAYSRKHLDVTFDVTCDTRKNLIKKLSNYELDWAVMNPIEDNVLPCFPLCSDRSLVFVSNNHRFAGLRTISLDQLKEEKLILCYKSNPAMKALDDELKKIGSSMDEMNVAIETNGMSVIKQLVENNVGVSVLQESACLREIREGRLVPLEIDGLEMSKDIQFVCRPGYAHPELFDELRDMYESVQL